MQLQQVNIDSVNKQLNLFARKTSKITHITNADLFKNENRQAFSKDMMKCTNFSNIMCNASNSYSEAVKLTIFFSNLTSLF